VSQVHLTFEESFAVPPDVLWAAISDHEGMSDWSGARVTIVAGPADGGVGTVRRVHARGLSFDEEVVYADAPRRLVYRIVRGLPLLTFHRGEILIEPWGRTGSQLRWSILISHAVPGAARAIGAALKPALQTGLAKLRTQLGERAQRSASATA
jgi:hypothetical protein